MRLSPTRFISIAGTEVHAAVTNAADGKTALKEIKQKKSEFALKRRALAYQQKLAKAAAEKAEGSPRARSRRDYSRVSPACSARRAPSSRNAPSPRSKRRSTRSTRFCTISTAVRCRSKASYWRWGENCYGILQHPVTAKCPTLRHPRATTCNSLKVPRWEKSPCGASVDPHAPSSPHRRGPTTLRHPREGGDPQHFVVPAKAGTQASLRIKIASGRI